MKEKDKIKIITDSGEEVEASTPVIISASRSTDIPAFYAKWFINRLKRGYAVWYNPFNRKPMYISFAKTKAVVFWTKNPAPMLPYLSELDKRGIHYYFQFTLNDYEKENYEPNVPPIADRIKTFKKLSDLIGKERVIWRFDPLILTHELTPRKLLNRIWHVGNELKGYTEKLVFSFIDIKAYRKVQNNLVKETNDFSKEDIENAEPNDWQIDILVEGLAKLRDYWKDEGWSLSLATCGEKIDLDHYGVEHNRCIDGELMKRIFSDDKEFLFYLHTGVLPERDLFGYLPELPAKTKNLKDTGQRKACGCIFSKDIGMYNTCSHLCVYCYANTSKKCVLNNLSEHSEESESIIQ